MLKYHELGRLEALGRICVEDAMAKGYNHTGVTYEPNQDFAG